MPITPPQLASHETNALYVEAGISYGTKLNRADTSPEESSTLYPDNETRNAIVEGNLHVAVILSRIYARRTGADYDDLYQVACETLLHAAYNYTPPRSEQYMKGSASFKTYASVAIKHAFHRFLNKSKKTRASEALYPDDPALDRLLSMHKEPSSDDSTFDDAYTNVTREKILAQISDPLARTVLKMYFDSQWKRNMFLREIAVELCRSLSTIQRAKRRGLDEIKLLVS
jgi:RNA polymerase sigma factor (sigma-70 family)